MSATSVVPRPPTASDPTGSQDSRSSDRAPAPIVGPVTRYSITRSHFALDVPSSEMTDHLLLRYTEHIVAAHKSSSEGQEVLTYLSSTLAPFGFTLKKNDPPVDLQRAGNRITILGLSIGLNDDGNVALSVPEEAWGELNEELLDTHGQSSPSRISQDVVKGWISYQGPAFESTSSKPNQARLRHW